MRRKIFSMLVLFFLITGCGIHRFYEGPDRPASELAILKGESPVSLKEINGKPGPYLGGAYNWGPKGKFLVELLPGSYTFKIEYREVSRISITESTYPLEITVNLNPGRIYEIKTIVEFGRWHPLVIDVTEKGLTHPIFEPIQR